MRPGAPSTRTHHTIQGALPGTDHRCVTEEKNHSKSKKRGLELRLRFPNLGTESLFQEVQLLSCSRLVHPTECSAHSVPPHTAPRERPIIQNFSADVITSHIRLNHRQPFGLQIPLSRERQQRWTGGKDAALDKVDVVFASTRLRGVACRCCGLLQAQALHTDTGARLINEPVEMPTHTHGPAANTHGLAVCARLSDARMPPKGRL